jgi:ankyrin repeat protein
MLTNPFRLVCRSALGSSTVENEVLSNLAKVFIEHGANVNLQDTNNKSPLHFALEYGYLDTARLLLDHGADPNALDNDHMTPLHLASERGHLEIVQLLLLRGANRDSRDKEARTALHLVLKPHWYAVCHSRFQFR